jgi:hypothetical protein
VSEDGQKRRGGLGLLTEEQRRLAAERSRASIRRRGTAYRMTREDCQKGGRATQEAMRQASGEHPLRRSNFSRVATPEQVRLRGIKISARLRLEVVACGLEELRGAGIPA